jgi:hypothetical protein
MNYFLEENDYQRLVLLSNLRTTKYTNSNGTKVSGKLFLLGVNIAKLASCTLNAAKNGNYFLTVEITRKAAPIVGLMSKVTFAPHLDFVFNYERVNELCKAFGHELKPCPDSMQWNVYLSHVKRRVDTFVGKELKVSVMYVKQYRKDDYGFVEQRNVYYDLKRDIEDYRQEMTFHCIDEDVTIDWDVVEHRFNSYK